MKEFIISIGLSFLLALLAYLKKAMTNSALILAFLFSIIITYYGRIRCFLILATVFLGTVIASKIKKEKRNKINKIIKKAGKKDCYQIIANVGLGTLTMVLFGITKNEMFLIVYASIMAESLADSLASDIGVLSKHKPINLKTFKVSTPGLSGNISLLGLFASLIGAFLIGLIFISFSFKIKNLIIITISGFLGALFDSFLGSIIQVKYKCPNCNTITEQENHCNRKGIKIEGYSLINNDAINFLSNFFAGVLSALILINQ